MSSWVNGSMGEWVDESIALGAKRSGVRRVSAAVATSGTAAAVDFQNMTHRRDAETPSLYDCVSSASPRCCLFQACRYANLGNWTGIGSLF